VYDAADLETYDGLISMGTVVKLSQR
jgi:hypothetical protein